MARRKGRKSTAGCRTEKVRFRSGRKTISFIARVGDSCKKNPAKAAAQRRFGNAAKRCKGGGNSKADAKKRAACVASKLAA